MGGTGLSFEDCQKVIAAMDVGGDGTSTNNTKSTAAIPAMGVHYFALLHEQRRHLSEDDGVHYGARPYGKHSQYAFGFFHLRHRSTNNTKSTAGDEEVKPVHVSGVQVFRDPSGPPERHGRHAKRAAFYSND
nr:hypothetical protein Iba_chr07fCG6960 [Ipomoea batatas]